jgi:hypothetical protein
MIGLSPMMVGFHFPGQRVLVAGLCLLAVAEWTTRQNGNWWWWGGWAAAAAVLTHPGALFLLPPAAIAFLFRRPRRVAVLGLLGVGIAVGSYFLWTRYTSMMYPDVRNNLVYYPFMRALDDQPSGGGVREIVATLSAEHWKDLALNRIKQLRHYFWADNPWQTANFERLKAISLTSTLGVALTAFAVIHLKRFGGAGVLWMLLFGPLIFFHLHIGQPFPQFHILPPPFFLLALVGLSALGRFGKWATKLVIVEALLHQLFIPTLVLAGFAGRFDLSGWFVGDATTALLVLTPLMPWAVLAVFALKSEPKCVD